MIELDINKIKSLVKQNVTKTYDIEQANLVAICNHHKTEGEIRYAAGELVEKILQTIFNSINTFLSNEKIVSKVGNTDYLTKEIVYKGKTYTNDTIQVDRHVWYKGQRIAFIENKTYLDSCYYDRALADFKKIIQSLCQHKQKPEDCLFIVFAGQKAANDNTLLNYEAEFCYETKDITDNELGIEPQTIYFLKNIRSSSKPLYKIKHELDFDNIFALVSLIINKIKQI